MEKTYTGKTIEDAVEAAAVDLGLPKDSFSYEIEEMPKKGFFGIGSVLAKIKVNYEISVEDKVEDYLSGLFNVIGLEGCKTSITVDGENVNIQIDGESAELFLKRHGEAIDALQMIIALSINHGSDNKYKVTLNINDYREKSKERLEALAHRVAKQVQKSHKRVTLNPMSAYQRRLIHTCLQNVENITTFSVGSEPNRKVVIAYQGDDRNERPVRKGGYNKKNGYKNTNTVSDSDSDVKFVAGEKKAPRTSDDGFEQSANRGGYNKKPYNKKSYDRPRQQRSDRTLNEETTPSEPTVELRAGEKRAKKAE